MLSITIRNLIIVLLISIGEFLLLNYAGIDFKPLTLSTTIIILETFSFHTFPFDSKKDRKIDTLNSINCHIQ